MEKATRDSIFGGIVPDFAKYKSERLSDAQVKKSTTLISGNDEMREIARAILEESNQYYNSLDNFRRKRIRMRNLYVGDHYEEIVVDPDTGESMTKGEYIRSQGMTPKKNNQVRQVIKNLLGQYRDNDTMSTVISRNRENQEAGEMMTKTLQYSLHQNHSKEIDKTQFEELLISGMFGWKTMYQYISERNNSDVKIYTTHPHRLFYNPGITDVRLDEIHTIGEILDVRFEDLLRSFAKNKADAQMIGDWYRRDNNDSLANVRHSYTDSLRGQDSAIIDDLNFLDSTENGRCRVYEIWKKHNELMLIVHDHMTGKDYEWEIDDVKELEFINEQRVMEFSSQGIMPEDIPLLEWEEKFEDRWHFWFLTPTGEILQHGVTPFDHEGSPYTLGLYPLVDGNIFGLISDIEDQQNAINENLTLLNFIIAGSAKGLLMIPEDVKPDGWTWDEYTGQWAKANGVIVYKPSKTHNQIPQQISVNSTNIGAMEQVQLQMQLLEKISGVTGAIQGHAPASGTPSSLYAQESHNATLANRDFFDFFYWRRKIRDYKVVKLIQQFYSEDRNITLAGREFNPEINTYIAEIGKNLELEMVIGDTKPSQAYRQLQDEFLFNLLNSQQIDIDTFLSATSMPFADQIKRAIDRRREELSQQQEQLAQQGGQMDPQAQQMIAQMGNQGFESPTQQRGVRAA